MLAPQAGDAGSNPAQATMIFAIATDGPTMLVMLSEKDIANMRQGRSTFIDERQTKGIDFKRAVFCINETDEDSLKMFEKAGHLPDIVAPEPNTGPGGPEGRCKVCNGIIPVAHLFEDQCLVCWATEAKRFRTESN